MNQKKLKILKLLKDNGGVSQRKLAEYTGFALGTTNNIIKELETNLYIIKEYEGGRFCYNVTNRGIEEIKKNSIKLAVILAAGLGSRLNSVTGDNIPKGMLEIEGKSLVERSINSLFENGIEKIIIVTGHLSNYYDNLCEKYENIKTIKNSNYANTGSMASLAVAKDLIKEDFLLLESDLIYEKRAIKELEYTDKKDCVLLSGKTNSGDEVYIEVRDNSIYKVSKDKHGLNSIYGELVGIIKVSMDLFEKMIIEYSKNTNPQYHYEYAIEDSAKSYDVGYERIEDLIWAEIDDPNHLKRVLNEVIPKLKEKNEI
ncbi:nucleotidyl transferase/aminotransferase [Clostridium botulinum H04402 065]|uniref:phosphocholine cytidylyltransferase family protein n=1 Tax=Clostridium botulinum TaxID=1491 RepID=UPI0001F84B31|nr:phosphocholine cytidylyltransferase family protein [Clostridium botulinum]CBZ04604.1 nucleotidyl transferase/aminotransferase [Clostridium botulinum H04402 065]